MKQNAWFYNPLTNRGRLAAEHRAAYEKSLNQIRAKYGSQRLSGDGHGRTLTA